jgi:hypothetical protein
MRTSVHERARIASVPWPDAFKPQLTFLNPDAGLTESDLNGSVTKQLITVARQSSHYRKKDIPLERGARWRV